jgi:RNA polymerase primary sigma factor
MSREEINVEQIRAAQAGDSDAMWAIVSGLDATLRGIVRSVAPGATQEDAEDYLQEARATLIQRIRDYDSETSSAALMTYVYRAARRAVAEAHIANSCPVTVPASATIVVRHLMWSHGGDLEAVWSELEAETTPTRKISREMFVAIVEALAPVDSVDAPFEGSLQRRSGAMERGDALSLADVLEDRGSEFSDSIERRDLARWLMTQIPQRQSLALRAFYGVGMTKQDEHETCADLGVKPAALRRIRSRGVVSARNVADAHGIAA